MTAKKVFKGYSAKCRKKTSSSRKKFKRKTNKHKTKNNTMYTYILHDKLQDIYKIGKTTSPISRFKNLCKKGRVRPIALAAEDVEKELHERFKEYRVAHPEYVNNGSTEWFKRGGKFSSFVDDIFKGHYLPYITLHGMVKDLVDGGNIVINDPNTSWELNESPFAYHRIGIEILRMLKVLQTERGRHTTTYTKHVLILGSKMALSEELVDRIEKKYKFYISINREAPIFKMHKKESSRLRKVHIESKDFDSEIFIMMNES